MKKEEVILFQNLKIITIFKLPHTYTFLKLSSFPILGGPFPVVPLQFAENSYKKGSNQMV